MLLRSRIVLAVFAAFLLLGAFDWVAQRELILPQFVALERYEAQKNVERCREAILLQADNLLVSCRDWAAWDDTYHYVTDGNDAYQRSNLQIGSFRSGDFSFMYFFDPAGKLQTHRCFDLKAGVAAELPDFERRLRQAPGDFTQHATTASIKHGLIHTKLGPTLVVSMPILQSSGEGPIGGTLVIGRTLDANKIADASEHTRVPFKIALVGHDELTQAAGNALAEVGSSAGVHLTEVSDDLLAGYTHFQDIDGRPILQLQAMLDRDILRQGRQALQFTSFTLMLACLVVLSLLLLMIQRIVIRPIHALTTHAIGIGTSGDASRKLGLSAAGEIGVLAGEFDRMVEQLADTYHRLMDLSHEAGKAQIASAVLHNVGNVLAAINCTTETVRSTLGASRLHRLGQLMNLLEEHAHNLPEFLTNDARGKQVVPYLTQLAARWQEEYESLDSKLASLTQHVDHINGIIAAQQQHATRTQVLESLSVGQLVREAVELCASLLEPQGIEVTTDIAPGLPAVWTDRAEVLQVLVNLLKNAGESITSQNPEVRQIRMVATLGQGKEVRIEVTDNGLGVVPEHLPKLFQHGFTTKPNGHGFGLHHSALSMQKLGGSVSARSEGSGQGATFVVTLPVPTDAASFTASSGSPGQPTLASVS